MDINDKIINLAMKSFKNLGYQTSMKSSVGGSDTNILNFNGITNLILLLEKETTYRRRALLCGRSYKSK